MRRSDALHHRARRGAQLRRAQRDEAVPTSPLRGAWQHPPYFHNGSAATLADVVDRYDSKLSLELTTGQRTDLVEYPKSL